MTKTLTLKDMATDAQAMASDAIENSGEISGHMDSAEIRFDDGDYHMETGDYWKALICFRDSLAYSQGQFHKDWKKVDKYCKV